MTSTTRRLRALVVVLLALLLAAAGALVASPNASATDPDSRPHVPQTWFWGAGTLETHLAGREGPPYTNDDSCRPSPRHPDPVILLHGTGGTAGNMALYAAELVNAGFCVWAPTYGKGLEVAGRTLVGGTTSIEHQAGPEVAGIIDHVLGVTGARKVDLVGVSLGGVVATYATKVHRPDKVDNVVGIATFWGLGDTSLPMGPLTGAFQASSDISPFPSQREFRPGSTMQRKLLGESGSPFVPGVDYTAITTDFDGLIPGALSYLPGYGMRHLRLQDGCPVNRSSHLTQTNDPRAVDAMMSVLDPSDTRPLRCVPTDGIIGPLAPVPPR